MMHKLSEGAKVSSVLRKMWKGEGLSWEANVCMYECMISSLLHAHIPLFTSHYRILSFPHLSQDITHFLFLHYSALPLVFHACDHNYQYLHDHLKHDRRSRVVSTRFYALIVKPGI